MVVTFEDPCNKDLLVSVGSTSLLEKRRPTIPNANTAPRPRTIPYPQPTLRGGAIAIFLYLKKLLAKK